MERREFNEPHIYNNFTNIINLNFNLNSLSFLLFLTKFINSFFQVIEWNSLPKKFSFIV